MIAPIPSRLTIFGQKSILSIDTAQFSVFVQLLLRPSSIPHISIVLTKVHSFYQLIYIVCMLCCGTHPMVIDFEIADRRMDSVSYK